MNEQELRDRLKAKTPQGWYGLAAPKGWYGLIDQLDKDLEEIVPGYEVHQIKEKFGGLRYYVGLPEEATEAEKQTALDLIHAAEDKSRDICTSCGTEEGVGDYSTGGWARTLCLECANSWAEEQGRQLNRIKDIREDF